MDRAITAVVIVAYLLSLAAIGAWSLRSRRSPADFFLAGGRLALLPVALAALASIMSGFVFVGGPGLCYDVGLGSFWIVISSSFTSALMSWTLAKPLHEAAKQGECLTLPDVIRRRYGCRFSGGAAAVAIFLGVVGYLATQLQALGLVLSTLLGLPSGYALWIGVAVLLFYCAAGGMTAAVYTDFIQGTVMLMTAVGVFVLALQAGGGLAGMSAAILSKEPAFLSPWGSMGPMTALGWFLLFAAGSLGQPHAIHKLMMLRDLRVLRYFPLMLAVMMMLCGLVWLGAGMAVKTLVLRGAVAAPASPDDAVNLLLAGFAPHWLATLAYAGVLSAIMSTADSFVNLGAAALARDLPRAAGRPLRREVLWGRLATLVLFAAGVGLAAWSRELVAYLGIFGFGTFAASLTPALAVGLNWPDAGRWAARLGIPFGLFSCLGLELAQRAGWYRLPVPPAALALILSFLVFLSTGVLTSPSRKTSRLVNDEHLCARR
jgi:Na+/proline symporter